MRKRRKNKHLEYIEDGGLFIGKFIFITLIILFYTLALFGPLYLASFINSLFLLLYILSLILFCWTIGFISNDY